MRAVKSIALAALVLSGGVAAGHAADPILYETSSDLAVPVYDEASFNWSGFYAGVFGAGQIGPTETDLGLGLALGVNQEVGFGLVGAEVAIVGLAEGDEIDGYAQALGRAGVLVTDELLAYGALGLGTEIDAGGENHLLIGGGLEYALADQVTVRGQYLYGRPLDGGDATQQVTLGANFHF